MVRLENISLKGDEIHASLAGVDLPALFTKSSRPGLSDINSSVKAVTKACQKLRVFYTESANDDDYSKNKLALYSELNSVLVSFFSNIEDAKLGYRLVLNKSYIEEAENAIESHIEDSKRGRNEDACFDAIQDKCSTLGREVTSLVKRSLSIEKEVSRHAKLPIDLKIEVDNDYGYSFVIAGIPKLKERMENVLYFQFLEECRPAIKGIIDAEVEDFKRRKEELLSSFNKLLKGKRTIESAKDVEELLSVGEFINGLQQFLCVWSEGFLSQQKLSYYMLKSRPIFAEVNKNILPMLEGIRSKVSKKCETIFNSSQDAQILDLIYSMNLSKFLGVKTMNDLIQAHEGAIINAPSSKMMTLDLVKKLDTSAYREIATEIKKHFDNKIGGEKHGRFLSLGKNVFVQYGAPKFAIDDNECLKELEAKRINSKTETFEIYEGEFEVFGLKTRIEEPIKITRYNVTPQSKMFGLR